MTKLTSEVDNFSADATLSLKIDGKVFEESTSNAKFDIKNKAKESIDKNFKKKGGK